MTNIYSDRYQAFLKKLVQARKEAGLTQVQAAGILGKPQSFISKCESGERRVDVIELQDFARIYNKPILFFVDDPKTKEAGP